MTFTDYNGDEIPVDLDGQPYGDFEHLGKWKLTRCCGAAMTGTDDGIACKHCWNLVTDIDGPARLPCVDCGAEDAQCIHDGRCGDCERVRLEAEQEAETAWREAGLTPEPEYANAKTVKSGDRVIGWHVTGYDGDDRPALVANVVLNDDGSVTVDDYDHAAVAR